MKEFANKKPSVNSTTWSRVYHDEGVAVYSSDKYFDFYKLTATGKRPKYYFGETAWMDVQREAVDLVGFGAYSIFA